MTHKLLKWLLKKVTICANLSSLKSSAITYFEILVDRVVLHISAAHWYVTELPTGTSCSRTWELMPQPVLFLTDLLNLALKQQYLLIFLGNFLFKMPHFDDILFQSLQLIKYVEILRDCDFIGFDTLCLTSVSLALNFSVILRLDLSHTLELPLLHHCQTSLLLEVPDRCFFLCAATAHLLPWELLTRLIEVNLSCLINASRWIAVR